MDYALRTPDLDDLKAMLPTSPVLPFALHLQDEMPLLNQLRHLDVIPSAVTKNAQEKWSHEKYCDKPVPMKTLSIRFSLCIYRANTRNVFRNLTPGKEIYLDKLSFGLYSMKI